MKKSILISGARGRLAHSLIPILEKSHELVLVSRTPGNLIVGIEDAFESEIFSKVDAVVHTAWSTVPAISERNPGMEWIHDLPYLVRIFNEFKKCSANPPIFIFLSSAGTVYGEAPGRQSMEDDPLNPIGWYGRGKVAGETLCKQFCNTYGIPLQILRISNPYGYSSTASRPQGLITEALKALKSERRFTIWGDGGAWKDFLYIEDLASAILSAVKYRFPGIYNVAYGKSHAVGEVLSLIEACVGKRLDLGYSPGFSWDVHNSQVDSTKFQSTFGWNPQYDIESGIRKCISSIEAASESNI